MNNNKNTYDSEVDDFNGNLSVYIPRVTVEWAQETRIVEVFHKNDLGVVERVDLVHKHSVDGNVYYQAFVHMVWLETQTTRNLQARIMDPSRQARIVHDDPNYWLLLENKNPMTAAEVRIENQLNGMSVRSDQQAHVVLGHLNRIMELETQMFTLTHQVKMNYWNDPILNRWTHADSDEIAPLWCHPVSEPTPTPTPSWCEDGEDTTKTMETYAEDANWFQSAPQWEQDNVCDYYDYEPYDMDIIE